MKPIKNIKNNYHLDITLAELAYQYLLKKHKPLTTGNLFWVMHKVSNKIDLINRGKKNKIIEFANGVCKYENP